MKVRIVVAVAFVLSCAAKIPAYAQGGFSIAPKIGIFVPTTNLGAVPVTADVYDVRNGPQDAALRSGVTFGITAQYDLPTRPFGLRFDIAHAPSLDVTVEGQTQEAVRATASSLAVSLIKPFRVEQVRPFVMAGVGIRSYRFGPSPATGPQFPSSNYDTEGVLGGGIAVDLRRFTVSAEVEDHFGTFQFDNDRGEGGGQRQLQNNVLVSLALRLRLQ